MPSQVSAGAGSGPGGAEAALRAVRGSGCASPTPGMAVVHQHLGLFFFERRNWLSVINWQCAWLPA